jgi:hypothetical protein
MMSIMKLLISVLLVISVGILSAVAQTDPEPLEDASIRDEVPDDSVTDTEMDGPEEAPGATDEEPTREEPATEEPTTEEPGEDEADAAPDEIPAEEQPETTEETTEESTPEEESSAPATPRLPSDALSPELDERRQTLLFGINSEVAELLPTLTRERQVELAQDVVFLFNTNDNRDVLRAAVEYLRELDLPDGHERSFQLVQEYFDRPADLITAVLNYLRETEAAPDNETLDVLVEMSRLTPTSRAVAAIRYFAWADTPIDELIALYREPGMAEDVRGRILIEMGVRGDPRAFDFVADVIGEDETATTALQRFAIDTLGRLEDERAIPIILRQFSSDDAMTRAYAVSALTNFDTEETSRALLAAMRDQFWRVRLAALQTVADRKMTAALPAVLYMLRRDPERPVRMQAIDTAVALDQREGWDLLLERMAAPRGNIEERTTILDRALRNIPSRAVPLVEEIMAEEWDKPNSRILDSIGRTVSVVEDRSLAPIAGRLLDHPNYIIQLYGLRATRLNNLGQYSERVRYLAENGVHPLVRNTAEGVLERTRSE